ncbi:sodium:solute symporter family transporter [Streptomyces hydrogenans]|uniref:sodium:solute symporter family transporter n=1 Tax=Streptomyces hydrogenans TaxID=1873719 RepID=UPI0037F7C960
MRAAAFDAPESFFTVFTVFLGLCGCLWVVSGAGDDDAAMFPSRSREEPAWRSGLVISGAALSAVTLMALIGLVALTGYDGMMLSLGVVMGLVLLALLFADPLRRAGGYTVGDALAHRFPERSVRLAMGLVTLGVCLPYVVLQLTAIGSLSAFVLGLTSSGAKTACILVIGGVVVSLAVSGGVRGTGRVQLVKVLVLLVVMAGAAFLVLDRFDWSPDRLLDAAVTGSGVGTSYLGPGVQYGSGAMAAANRFGQLVTVALAVCCLPHVTMRVLGSPGGRATHRAMRWAVGQLIAISALLLVVGLGAAAVLGGPALSGADPTGSIALLLVTQELSPGGILVSAVFSAVFLTALTTVADVTLAAAASVARDLLPRRPRPGTERVPRQDRRARWAAAGVGAATVGLSLPAADWNLLVLSTLAMTLAASALAPVLVYTFLWRGFTRRGLLWSVYGTSVLTLALVAVSPLFSGSPSAAFPDLDLQVTALVSPGLLTVPAGFALGWLGSVLDRGSDAPARYASLAAAMTSDNPAA